MGVVAGALASLVQRGKDCADPARFVISAVKVEFWVVLVHDAGDPLDPGAVHELVHIGLVSVVLQVSGMFLAVIQILKCKWSKI